MLCSGTLHCLQIPALPRLQHSRHDTIAFSSKMPLVGFCEAWGFRGVRFQMTSLWFAEGPELENRFTRWGDHSGVSITCGFWDDKLVIGLDTNPLGSSYSRSGDNCLQIRWLDSLAIQWRWCGRWFLEKGAEQSKRPDFGIPCRPRRRAAEECSVQQFKTAAAWGEGLLCQSAGFYTS